MVFTCLSPYWGGGWGMVFMIIFWVGAIVLIFWILSKMNKGEFSFCHGHNHQDHDHHKRNDTEKSALGIAQERYAQGEISKKEYEEMKKELKQK